MAERQPFGNGQLVALPGTLLPPMIFGSVELPRGWRWSPVDWLRSQNGGDLAANAEALLRNWPSEATNSSVLIGHSAGGVIALQVAAELGARLAGLVLIDTGASALNHGDPELPQRLLAQWGDAFIEAFLLRCVGDTALKQHGEALGAYARAVGPTLAHQAMISLRQLDLTQRLADIRCPTLVVHGERDPARQREHAQTLAAGIESAELCWLDAGHTPMLECPHRLGHVIADFLGALPTR